MAGLLRMRFPYTRPELRTATIFLRGTHQWGARRKGFSDLEIKPIQKTPAPNHVEHTLSKAMPRSPWVATGDEISVANHLESRKTGSDTKAFQSFARTLFVLERIARTFAALFVASVIWHDIVLGAYSDKMQEQIANALGIDKSQLQPLNGRGYNVLGGNANFVIPQSVWSQFASSCSDGPFGPGYRCGLSPSLHFETDGTLFWVHMDSGNPNSGFGLGAFIHVFLDVILGNTVFDSGVPH